MTAMEALKQVGITDRRVNAKLALKRHYIDMATSGSARLSFTPYGSEYGPSKVENYAVKLADLEGEIDAEVDRLIDARRQVMEVIQTLPDVRYQYIMEARYIACQGWVEIAEGLGISVSRTYALHADALEAFVIAYDRAQENNPKKFPKQDEIVVLSVL